MRQEQMLLLYYLVPVNMKIELDLTEVDIGNIGTTVTNCSMLTDINP